MLCAKVHCLIGYFIQMKSFVPEIAVGAIKLFIKWGDVTTGRAQTLRECHNTWF